MPALASQGWSSGAPAVRDKGSRPMEVRPEPIRASRRLPIRLLVAVVVLAVAAVAVGASLARPGALTAPDLGAVAAAGASAAPTAAPDASGQPGRPGFPGRWMMPGILGPGVAWPSLPDGRGGGFLPGIAITAIDGAQVSLKSANGWTRTIDTTGVTITRAGATITVGDLKVGDHVAIGETRNSDGSYTVNKLTVVLDQVAGTISKIDSASITVTRQGGQTATVKTDASTVYRRAGQTIARSDLVVGERLVAMGTTGSDGSLQAASVDVQPETVFGTVTAKSGDTLTIATLGGGTATVKVTSTTTYQVAGKTSATLADIAVNDQVIASGVRGSDGALTATTIRSGSWRTMRPLGKGPSFPGWPGSKGASPAPSASAGASG